MKEWKLIDLSVSTTMMLESGGKYYTIVRTYENNLGSQLQLTERFKQLPMDLEREIIYTTFEN